LIEIKEHITNTIVVCPVLQNLKKSMASENRLNEAVGLCLAIRLNVVFSSLAYVKEIKPAGYFSKGYIEKLLQIAQDKAADLLVVDAALSPVQQRFLENALRIKVIDRTALILEIFGERAQTSEGKLQVELAHLTYQRSRLVRGWTHLERQRGGAGFLGGPGEKQIELDRRLIDDKIVKIKKELEKVKNTRGLQRANRQKVPYPIVALVGYTNAGKSSLFNALTKDNVMVADMLFATLDPVLRKIRLKTGVDIVLSDTVGFISDLPHELVMAFRSTLEEVLEAEMIVHVLDVSNQDCPKQRADVLDVLHKLGLKNIEYAPNYIEVFNKTDLLSSEEQSALFLKTKNKNAVSVSALTGAGCQALLELILQRLTKGDESLLFEIPIENGKAINLIYQNARVVNTTQNENSIIISAKTSKIKAKKLKSLLKEFVLH